MNKIIHGENEFDISIRIDDIKDSLFSNGDLDTNLSVIDYSSIEIPYLTSVVSTVPFLSENRLVIIQNLLSNIDSGEKKYSEILDDIENILQNCPPTTNIIFVENKSLKGSGKSIKKISSYLEIEEIKLPRGRELNPWIKNRVEILDGKISSYAISRIAYILGNNLRLIDQELKKLILYCGEKTIEVSDLDLLVSEAREGNIFAAIDALLQQKSAIALKSFHKLLNDGATVSSIINMIHRQIRLLILINEIKKSEVKPSDIGKRIGINSNFAIEKLMQQSKLYNLNQLVIILRKLVQMDLEIKTGKIDENIGIEIIISELSQNA